jgi:Raf kinase inhibitor-like YbhB/YbcL family protein
MWRAARSIGDRQVGLALAAALAVLFTPTSVAAAGSRLALQSPDISPGGAIPLDHVYDQSGCQGGNTSPALYWNDPPAGTRSFAVLMFDPDAPGGWWHWGVFDISAGVRSLPVGAGNPARHLLPAGAVQVRNDFGSPGYAGPCPPPGPPHHYRLMLYALRVARLGLDASASAAQVAARVRASALAEADIVASYGR